MSNQILDKEKTFTGALVQALGLLSETPSREFIFKKAMALAAFMEYDGPIDAAVDMALNSIDSRMGEGVSLIKQNTNHDELWVEKRTDINWMYSSAYEEFLKKEGWNPRIVNSLSDVCLKILGNLQDPLSPGAWKRRGLVIGHVQSGKTANYMGLIAKAADAGYKFIIVIAGIHNNLRRQTQERFDEGFIGMSSDPSNRVHIGVGLDRNYRNPATLTTIYDDFNKVTAARSGWQINDFTKPIILIIKKNVKTLDELYKWLSDLNTRGGKISDVPMLLIDDEADNASINTNKPDISPTRTNAGIRKILSLFEKSSFVGYTATPFANIFINPDAYDEKAEEELFPSDFIYALDAPNTYFGPSKVFSSDEFGENNYLRVIEDCNQFIPENHKSLFSVQELPPSLYSALYQFVLIKAIRILRGQDKKHCSMMINVSRFVAVQNQVKSHVADFIRKAAIAIQANYKKSDDKSQTNKIMRELKGVYDCEFADSGFDWASVKNVLQPAIASIKTFVVNSKTEDVLDYKGYEKNGGLTAIAVGGLSLSRGLTIEGLCVSYMYRNTKMYDTLMQMGRWFGYRYGYEDLCRIHLSNDSIEWYRHISDVSEELRDQIYSMRRAKKSPRDFGLYVRSHDEALMITAPNKMRSSETIKTNVSYSGKVKETYILSDSVEVNRKNEILVAELFSECKGLGLTKFDKGWFLTGISSRIIEKFINKFEVHSNYNPINHAVKQYFTKISDKYEGLCDITFISKKDGKFNAMTPIGAQDRKSAEQIDGGFALKNRRAATAGDEKYGLTPQQIIQAEEIFKQDEKGGGKVSIPDRVYREVRKRPLLMVHIFDPIGTDSGLRVPAYGLSFPMGDEEKLVEIVVNSVWLNNQFGSNLDDPDFEDDYDL